MMRIFPLNTNITFLVSATLYDEITANNFLLVVDYNDIKTDTKRCKIHLRQKPNNIHNLRMVPEYVEYLIEKTN
jgi:hypothetical protein